MTTTLDVIPLPLYHGTSSLFLEGILEFGLGGKSPLAEWKVLELARSISPLVEQHFADRDDLMLRAASFQRLADQLCAALNFQHGQSYVSPSIETAVRYASSNRYGSELLTYTLEFLQILSDMKVPGVNDRIYRQFPQPFELLQINPAPLLIRLDNVPRNAVLKESGDDPSSHFKIIDDVRNGHCPDMLLQQTNFRLIAPHAVTSVWLINVRRADAFLPEYSLHELKLLRHRA